MYTFSRILLLIGCAAVFAAPDSTQTGPTLTLYQQPDIHSQVISTISPQAGVTIVPVTWVQIRDPETQKLGWVQQNALRQVLQQNPIDIAHITTNTHGPYRSVSTVRTVTDSRPDKTYIKTIEQQHEALQDNVKQAFQQIRAMEAKLFDDVTHQVGKDWQEPPEKRQKTWSSLLNWD